MTLDMDNVHEFMAREMDALRAEGLYRALYGDGWPFGQGDRPPVPLVSEFVACYVNERIEARRLYREVGPILGPGRQEWAQARRPYNRNRAIRNTMPGKHPLEYIPAHRLTAPPHRTGSLTSPHQTCNVPTVPDQAMTRAEYDQEVDCATCHRPLADRQTVRNRDGRLVHTHCPSSTERLPSQR